MSDLLEVLVEANLALSAGMLVVMALRRPVRRSFGARVAYALWLVPALAAAGVLLPQPASQTLLTPMVEAVAEAAAPRSRAIPATGALSVGLAALWAFGAVAAAVVLGRRQAGFLKAVRRGEAGPAVVGVLAPRIVIPKDFEHRFAPHEREVILRHEAQHLASRDALANACACAVQCLCWFNPLAHVGARLMRIDQELACDAAVLARTPQARRLYGEVLLKTQLAGQSAPFGCHWPAQSEHPLKERIAMLKSPAPSRLRRRLGFAVAAAFGFGAAAMAWAAQAPAPVITQPDWVRRPAAGDIAHVYPPAALAQGLSGMAVIDCRVSSEGVLTGCTVFRHAPEGAGFGEAALALAGSFQMRPSTKDGQPVGGGRVRIPIRFAHAR